MENRRNENRRYDSRWNDEYDSGDWREERRRIREERMRDGRENNERKRTERRPRASQNKDKAKAEVRKISQNWIVRNLVGGICFILGVMLVSSLALKIITNHNQELSVPDFTNMTFTEAKQLAAASHVKLDITDSVYVRRMARGAIYRQNPVAGSAVKKDRRIIITINAVTPKKVTMPNLIGYSMRQAKAELLSRGLRLGNLIYVNDMATNNVLRQLCDNREIPAGNTIESETEIDLVLGLNEFDHLTYVPDLAGMKMIAATDAIHDNSLNVRKCIFDKTVKNYSDTLNAVVYRQTPEATEEPCQMGSEVTIYLTVDREKNAKK